MVIFAEHYFSKVLSAEETSTYLSGPHLCHVTFNEYFAAGLRLVISVYALAVWLCVGPAGARWQ